MQDTPTSTVLILEEDAGSAAQLKRFCHQRDLVAVRVARERLFQALRSKAELGAIVLAQGYAGSAAETARLAASIQAARPEVPIILLCPNADDTAQACAELEPWCCAAFCAGDWPALETAINEHIFALIYPSVLVRGISEITRGALESQFSSLVVSVDTPYISRDRIIFGEVLTLIPLESAWCRGYMLMQVEEAPLLEHLAVAKPDSQNGFRAVNSALSEITNLVWGGFKNRYIGDHSHAASSHVQVPLVINHHHRYISFGSEKPQLCFQYQLKRPGSTHRFHVYQRFCFNLNWSPEDFREVVQPQADAVDAGELELF